MTNDLQGKIIRGYHIREVIGSGGFGVVYKAYQPIIERDVAIKIIHAKYANQLEFTRRFDLEARLIARLESQHIVPVYDYWRDPTGAYLVMRWLRGHSLRTVMMEHRTLPLNFIVKVFFQLVNALDIAHQHHVIHRDIKPENVLFDIQQNVYLTDFGIAVDILHTPQEITVRTLSLGSPVYMAPEQLAREVTSPQADIYSLGIMLYEMLAGKMPFVGTITEIIKHKREALPLPSLRETRADLPPEVDAVIWQATAHVPMARFASVIEFFNALVRALPISTDFSVLQSSTSTIADSPTSIIPIKLAGENTMPIGRDTQIVQHTPAPKADDARLTTQHLEANIRNPFKGLRPFDEIDARDFFGRSEAIRRLCDFFAEADNRFLAVVGPSGSGKSSLVRAGLLAVVRQHALPHSQQWMIATMTPTDNPHAALSEALSEISIQAQAPTAEDLYTTPTRLHEQLGVILPHKIDLFLLIDQFEEVFTLCADEARVQHFLTMLHYCLTHDASRLRLVITLRADYYDRPLQHPQFGELIRKHTEVVLPLTDLALEEIIIEPALQVGLAVQPELKVAILHDVSGQRGALPLLQYTLSELFQNRGDSNVLLYKNYEALGGVSGALSRRADSLYNNLSADEQAVAQQLFLRCVTITEGIIPTRKRALMTDLLFHLPTAQRHTLQHIIETFAQWRLLTLDRDPISRTPTVEIAHEALITAWSRLKGWIEDNRADLRRYYQLQMLTQAWLEADKDPSFLVTGARLNEFEGLCHTPFITLSPDEHAFVQSGIALRQRRERLSRWAVVILALFALFTGMLALFALYQGEQARRASAEALSQRDRANASAQIARSRELAANALASLNQLDVALLLGYYATTTADTYEARNSLLTALQTTPYIHAYAHGHVGDVRAVAYDVRGGRAVSAGQDRIIRIWRTSDWSLLTSIQTDHADTINALALSGDTLFSASADGTIRRWLIADQTTSPMTIFGGHNSPVWDIAVHPDGSTLFSGHDDGALIAWDIDMGTMLYQQADAHNGAIYALALSPDGALLATGGADNTVRFWDAQTGAMHTANNPSVHTNWVSALAFGPSGKLLASSGADGRVVFWDTTRFSPTRSITLEDDLWVRGMTYNPTGEMLALAGLDGSLRIWDVMSGQMFGTPYIAHQSGIWDVASAPSNNQFITGGADGRVVVWHFMPPYRPATRAFITGRDVLSMAVHPTGKDVAAGLSNGQVQLWDVPTGNIHTRLSDHQSAVVALAYSPSGAYLATLDVDKTLIVWHTDTMTNIYQQTMREAVITPSILFVDETSLFIAGETGLIQTRFITPSTSEFIAIDMPNITRFALSHDGQWLAIGGATGDILLINRWHDGASPIWLSGHTGAVTGLAFAQSRQLLVSASRDNTLIIWDYPQQRPLYQPLRAHADWVLDVAISPDDRLMASVSRDQTVILWDLSTARPLGLPFMAHSNWVQRIAFDMTGDWLYSAGRDGVIFEWMTSLPHWQQLACQISNRQFRDDEWQRYFEFAPPPCQ